jgi:Domain of unknown function (DUF5666)
MAKSRGKRMENNSVSGEEYRHMVATSRPPKKRRWDTALAAVAAAVVVAALGFYGGMRYQKNHDKNTLASSQFGVNRAGGGAFFRGGGGLGQVTSISPSSITINNFRTGSSQTFSITSSTKISDNGQAVTPSDIKTGDTVVVRGAGQGSTTADTIIVNPQLGGVNGPVMMSSPGLNSQTITTN